MKIAVSSIFDPLDANSWSGCSASLLSSLRHDHGHELEILGPICAPPSWADRLRRRYYKCAGKNYLHSIRRPALEFYAQNTADKLADSDADILLALDAHTIAYLRAKLPVFYYWDCTFLGNLEYPWFANLCDDCITSGHEMERRALAVATRAFFSSKWAIDTAIEGYGVAPEKLRIVPLAANLPCSRHEADILSLLDLRRTDQLELLFLGVDWHRKGGDLALQIARGLNHRNIPTRLTVVGCIPLTQGETPQFVDVRGFLSKQKQDEFDQLEALIERSHFLIVPSLAESFGAVFCEASSYGVPSLARRVDGIESAVLDDVNGKLFPPEAGFTAYCDYVESKWRNPEAYRQLALSSFHHYKTHLTWKTTSSKLVRFIEDALAEA